MIYFSYFFIFIFWILFCFVFLFVCLLIFFNNSVSSSICKLAIRSEIYNCTVRNTNKVSIIVILYFLLFYLRSVDWYFNWSVSSGRNDDSHFTSVKFSKYKQLFPVYCCFRGRLVTKVILHETIRNIVATLLRMVTTLFQHCNSVLR